MSVLTLNVDEVRRTLSASGGDFVTHDKEVDIVRFAINSGFADIVLDGQVALRVMYQRPGESQVRAQTLTYYDTDGLHNYYDWQLSQSDLAKNGSLMVALCILDISGGEVSEWHTTPCAVRVLPTIHTDDSDEGDAEVTPTVKERVAVLESMIQRVASGAPIVVASTSDMTDTNQIYVLSTNGRWYYHNGSVWTAGGEYGAVATDTTLTQSGVPADAKKTGDEISELKEDLKELVDLEFSTIDGKFINKNDGTESSSASYVASDYIGVNKYVWLYSRCGDDNSGYAFYDESKSPISYGQIYPINLTWTKLTVPDGAKYFRASCAAVQSSIFAVKIPLADNIDYLLQTNPSDTLDGINYDNGYYPNNAGVIGRFEQNVNYKSKQLLVSVGETYLINGAGGSSARLWSTHDVDGNTVRVADANTNAQQTAVKVQIQSGEYYLVFNTTASATKYGLTNGKYSCSTVNTRDHIFNNASKIKENSYTFRNNIKTDGVSKLPNCKIYNNGVVSNANYGLVGSVYKFDMQEKPTHLYFEFLQSEKVESSVPSTVSKKLINAFNGGVFYLAYKGSEYSNCELYQKYTMQIVSGSQSNGLTPTMIAYDRLQGKDAIGLRYTNQITNSSVCTVTFNDASCVVNVDGVTETIDCSVSTTITDFIDAINEIEGIEATALIVEGYYYSDLLPVVSKSSVSATEINLIYSGTLYDATTYKDAPTIYIPLAVSDVWHSVEMIYDTNGRVSVALDGITVSTTYGGTSLNNILSINDGGLPIVIRNLEVDYGGFGDAELVDNLVDPNSTPSKQLISNHNPRVLIYEGHGVDVCTDAEAPITDNMACSTERLRILFDTARARGYVPVTWQNIIDWKINGKPLPKRCYTMMFDDWRFENYVNYDKRKPFVDANVKAGLAVITNYHALDETFTVNGIDYTVDQIVDIVKTAGWYPTSHTHGHRRINDYTPTANVTFFKEDVLEADKYGIHSDVLVYPYGEFEQQYIGALKHSGFGLGVNIARNTYNCRGSSNYYLVRVEVGTRVALSTALYPLV